jgi:hypothetical protein
MQPIKCVGVLTPPPTLSIGYYNWFSWISETFLVVGNQATQDNYVWGCERWYRR